MGSIRNSTTKPTGTAATVVEKTNGIAGLGHSLTAESVDQSTAPPTSSEAMIPSSEPHSGTIFAPQKLAVICKVAYCLSAVKRTVGMQKPNGAPAPHSPAVFVWPFP